MNLAPVATLALVLVCTGCCDCSCPSDISPTEGTRDIPTDDTDVASCVSPGDEMVMVPEGTFWMGCNAELDHICSQPTPLGNTEELPYHEVHLSSYYIDRHETTNRTMATFLTENGNLCDGYPCWDSIYNDAVSPWYLHDGPTGFRPGEGYEDYPAMGISWYGAMRACEWQGKRLCTEAEWEKGARGTDGRIYPWGNSQPNSDKTVLRETEGGDCVPQAVGTKPDGASPYGVENQMGNASEWVSDWYNFWYYPVSPVDNPQGPTSGNTKAVRGSSFCTPKLSDSVGVSRRSSCPLSITPSAQGFRCCRDACPASN